MSGCRLDSSGSGYRSVADLCEHAGSLLNVRAAAGFSGRAQVVKSFTIIIILVPCFSALFVIGRVKPTEIDA
jgi:hypothetical protein